MEPIKYIKLDQREHVLKRPTMYVGSVALDTSCKTWVWDDGNKAMARRAVEYVPALLKIFDEILVNAIDHCTRTAGQPKPVKNIKVTIQNDRIEVTNDGEGLEVSIHPEYNVYIPELIFGNLLTSSNFDDEALAEKMIGGMNGLGAKLTNIFSKVFQITTVDSTRGKQYQQEFRDNMTIVGTPRVTPNKKYPFTTITFVPDYEKFGLGGMTEDIRAMFMRRAYDVCALTPASVTVTVNDVKLTTCKTFSKYIDLYGFSDRVLHEQVNELWDVAVAYNGGTGFDHVSFVNGIHTIKGGKHVDCVVDLIVKGVRELIEKKAKISIKPQHVKDNVTLFIRANIPGPTFDSQAKVRFAHCSIFITLSKQCM